MNKKPRSLSTMQFLIGVTFALTAALSGNGQTSLPVDQAPASSSAVAGGIVVLPAFGVTGSAANQYQASDAMSASRIASKIIDTPMTVNVITPALIQDLAPDTLFDVAQYFAGISSGRGSGTAGIQDRMTFRGFESMNRTLDSFSGFIFPMATGGDANVDPVFTDHVELIMGPDTILSPNGSPGGTVNLISKSPLFQQRTNISAEVGNRDANKYTIDTTGPIGDGRHMAYRLIGAYQDAHTSMPGSYIIFSGAAEFTYKFSDKAQLMVKYFGQQTMFGGAAMLCNLNGEEIYTPDTVGGATVSQTPQPGFQYNGWNGDASWSYRTIRDNTAEAELTAALSERVNMRFAAQLYCDQMTAVYGYPAPSLPESWDPASGKETSVASINPAALPVFGAYAHSTAREIQVQNDYAGNFKVGGVSIQPVLGIQYQRGRVPMNFIIFDKTLPPANLAVGYYPVPRPPISQFNTLGTELPETGWIGQTYGYLRVGLLNDHLFLTAGASRTWAHVNDYSINSYYLPGIGLMGSGAPNSDHTFSDTRNSLMPSVQPWHDSYMAGILCKVLPNVSVYSSFSTNASVADSTPLWNAGKQYEFGVKCNFFDNRLAVSVDHFQLSESNVSSTNPLYNLGQSTIPLLYANLVNHGYEVNVDGGITKNLSVIMSYTDQKLRDFVGRRRRNIPDNMASLLLNYRFAEGPLKNANVFAGLIHQGDVAGENVNGFTSLGVPEQVGFYVAAFNVINAGAGYKFHHYSFSLNVDNALNQRFWWQASSRSSLASYPSIGIRLATKFDF